MRSGGGRIALREERLLLAARDGGAFSSELELLGAGGWLAPHPHHRLEGRNFRRGENLRISFES